MAILKTQKTVFGLTVTDAYIKIGSFNGTTDTITVTLEIFADETARRTNKRAIDILVVNLDMAVVNSKEGDLVAKLYKAIKDTYIDWFGETLTDV